MEGGSDPSMPSPLPGPQKPLDGGGDDPATSHEDQQTHPMLRAYYYGQLAQVKTAFPLLIIFATVIITP